MDLRAKCDLCLSNPCQNSASCETKPNRDYVCHCPPGYYGKMGKCRQYTPLFNCLFCIHRQELRGRHRRLLRQPLLERRQMQRHGGWSLHVSGTIYLLNLCFQLLASPYSRIPLFSCQCPVGYSGFRCEVNDDDCVDHKCVNNATCVDEVGAYRCSCPDGFQVSLF